MEKAKTEIIKLIIKVLKEIGIQRKMIDDEDEEDTKEWIEKLCK